MEKKLVKEQKEEPEEVEEESRGEQKEKKVVDELMEKFRKECNLVADLVIREHMDTDLVMRELYGQSVDEFEKTEDGKTCLHAKSYEEQMNVILLNYMDMYLDEKYKVEIEKD